MTDLSHDPIVNVIHQGIKKGIRVAIENQCYGSAVILILSAIDTMAFLAMPPNHQDVTREAFVAWVDRYIGFPCKDQLAGLDLYGARCGMLHSFSTVSRLSRTGACREVGYMDHATPEVVYSPSVSKQHVLVSIKALADALFKGIDRFLIDLFSDKQKAVVAEERLTYLVYGIHLPKQKKTIANQASEVTARKLAEPQR